MGDSALLVRGLTLHPGLCLPHHPRAPVRCSGIVLSTLRRATSPLPVNNDAGNFFLQLLSSIIALYCHPTPPHPRELDGGARRTFELWLRGHSAQTQTPAPSSPTCSRVT